jgi:hypothetical protein
MMGHVNMIVKVVQILKPAITIRTLLATMDSVFILMAVPTLPHVISSRVRCVMTALALILAVPMQELVITTQKRDVATVAVFS